MVSLSKDLKSGCPGAIPLGNPVIATIRVRASSAKKRPAWDRAPSFAWRAAPFLKKGFVSPIRRSYNVSGWTISRLAP
jgi:hypothetical protein